ncbi:MAG TPA: ATP-binding cassette domain-containing protein [Methanofastidiosum sp.]|jgi:ABC-2 type transport system ATP-binding protein|nr:ATP-binding cassette domain-containing protein [Methanofastidiosum sp.]HOR87930.1 ATP-binding cassette domain-containing protein [Methanofastidiosum sp.]HOT85027.1 ATP-binding cassette domain-containing protein [Methanofastidiosum sp.]HPL00658.1 ATP-binding cassette domain-containing protein [Methanofastidiosum sp.]HPX25132.1 ATP-binding cassette domain-containing protein [Methanofastidiosum sp.]
MISTNNLTKKFENLIAVDNLNLNINEGEIFGLLGPNGAGKTTTILMLTTLKLPTSGTATINGYDIVKDSDKVRKSIGIVFQDPSSDEILTGYENLKLHGWLYDMPDKLREDRIKEVLELVDLTARKDDLVKKYSGGMRRRLELARGLMHHPKVLFLDEPTLGLDPQSRDYIWSYIEKLAKEEKITIVLTTHYMDEADKLCDRLAIIDYGKIIVLGTPEELKKELGGDIIKLKANNLNIESLKRLNYIKNIAVSDGEVCLTVEDANKHVQDILSIVGKVKSTEIRSPTLDDVFIHYTGRGMREDSPEGGWAEKAMHARIKK